MQVQLSLVGGDTVHCGKASFRSGPGGASSISVMAGTGLVVTDSSWTRVVGVVMVPPVGSDVNPQ